MVLQLDAGGPASRLVVLIMRVEVIPVPMRVEVIPADTSAVAQPGGGASFLPLFSRRRDCSRLLRLPPKKLSSLSSPTS